MRLWIVVNEYLRTEKFVALEKSFEKAAGKLGVPYSVVTNAQCMIECSSDSIVTGPIPRGDDPVLFWDKDIKLARVLELNGHRVYNSSEAIRNCDDKSITAYILSNNGIRTPKTVIQPMTYSNIGYTNIDFVDEICEKISFPMIVKKVFGSFGQQVYLCNDKDNLVSIVKDNKAVDLLIFQEYINTSFGRDIRIQIVGNKVCAAMYRYSEKGDFRANLSNGASMKRYTPNDAQIDIALRSMKALGLDFAGVDILFGENDEPVVCEVNSNAHFTNIDNCTGSDIAMDIVSYIIDNHGGMVS